MSEKATVVAAVLSTTNYSIFSRMPGNRSVEYSRIAKLKKSIETNGWIRNPIIVNEKLQIIDGQGRFEALKSLNLPVEYIVSPGTGMRECLVFNNTQTKWTTKDYVSSYAESGNTSYIMLKKLLEDFKALPLEVVTFVCYKSRKIDSRSIPEGRFQMDESYYPECREILEKLLKFSELTSSSKFQGSKSYFLEAAVFAMGLDEIDSDLLLRKCTANISKAIPVCDMWSGLQSLEIMYNTRSSEKVYLTTAYDKYLRGKYAWYGKKWGDARIEK